MFEDYLSGMVEAVPEAKKPFSFDALLIVCDEERYNVKNSPFMFPARIRFLPLGDGRLEVGLDGPVKISRRALPYAKKVYLTTWERDPIQSWKVPFSFRSGDSFTISGSVG